MPDQEMNERLKLIREAFQDRDRLLGECVEQLRPRVLRLIRDRPQVSERDVCQETYLRGLQHFHRFQGESVLELRSWLNRILTNVAFDEWRRRVEKLDEEVSGSGPTASALALDQEALDWINRAIAELNHESQVLIELRLLKGWEWAAIATHMNFATADQARQAYQAVLKELRQKLDDIL